MSILLLIEEALRRDTVAQNDKQAIIDDAKNGGPEFCVSCYKTLGYSAMSTHVDDPKRWSGGAYYTEGCGQTCARCATNEARARPRC